MPPFPVPTLLQPDADAERAGGADSSSRESQLPRELAEFLMDLSVALHKHAIYPRGHPLLDQAVDSVHRGLGRLLLDRPALSIGVARRQLIIEGVATDSSHPMLAELAGRLHRHHIGAVKFLPGIAREELSDMLATVGLEAQRDEQPIGMQPELLQSRWADVKLFPLTYDRLELLDEDDAAESETAAGGMRGGHAAQLWVGLARAAIASDLATQPEHSAMEPEAVAHAIDEHDREQAYDQVIVGYLLQIAREVRKDGTQEGTGLQRRISKLVGSLQPATLKRLLEMGGDTVQRRRFVLDASQGMTVDAVVELVQAAASAEGQTISHSFVRMLTKLASHAGSDASARSRAADGAFREHVERLVGSWSLDDPNPAAYSAALSHIAQTNAAPARDLAAAELACEPGRLVGMALEIDALGDRVSRAVTAMLDAGALGELLDLLDSAPDPAGTVATSVWRQFAAREPLRALLAAPRLEHAVIRRLVTRLGESAAGSILEALDGCPEGSRQERLLSYLVQIGVDAAPAVAEHLGRASSPLARELLICLAKLAPPEPPLEAGPYLNHFDAALRRESAKLLLAYEATREATLLSALRDADERVVYVGLLAAASGCTPELAAIIRQRIDRDELIEGTVRAAGIRAVSGQRDDTTLEWILGHALVTGGLLRRTRLAAGSPELLASLTALAVHWGDDPRATVALTLARRSASPTVRAASQTERAR